MPPEMLRKLERLAGAAINLLPLQGVDKHYFLERDGFVTLVERVEEGFGKIGGAGLLSERGFCALVWRADGPFFVARGFEQRAETAQVELLRKFDRDVRSALSD